MNDHIGIILVIIGAAQLVVLALILDHLRRVQKRADQIAPLKHAIIARAQRGTARPWAEVPA